MMTIAGLILTFGLLLLLLVPVAAIRQGSEMAASGVISSLFVGALALPFYLGAVIL